MIKKSFISMKMIINKEDTPPPPPPIAAPVRDNKVFESSLVASDIGEAGKKKKSKGKTVQGL